MTAPATTPAAGRRHWWPLVAVCLGTFMLLVDVTIVNVALPDMAVDLGASFSGLQWVIDVYALALAALLLAVGSLADIVGRRRTYLVGLVVFVLASFACGVAPSEAALIVARGVQGIGAAAMFATTIALLNSTYHGRDRGTAFGVWGATAGAAAAAGPIVGGLLTDGLSWRWIFFVNVPVGILTIALAATVLAESRRDPRPRLDVAGAVAFTLAAGAATYALVRVSDVGWTSTATIATLVGAVVALAAFVAIERRTAEPLFDLQLLRRPSFVGILIGALLLSVSAFGSLVYVSLWLQSVLGMSAIGAGFVTLPLSGGAFVVSLLVGRMLHGASARWAIGGGLLLIGVGGLMQVGVDGGSRWPSVLAGLAVTGIGVGLATPTLVSAAMGSVPHDRGGMAAGAVNTARQLGLAMGIAILGSIFSSRIEHALQQHGVADPGGAAHAIGSGAGHALLRAVPSDQRGALDALIHDAAGSGLSTVFLVAGLSGIVAGLAVIVLLRERAPRTAGATVEADATAA